MHRNRTERAQEITLVVFSTQEEAPTRDRFHLSRATCVRRAQVTPLRLPPGAEPGPRCLPLLLAKSWTSSRVSSCSPGQLDTQRAVERSLPSLISRWQEFRKNTCLGDRGDRRRLPQSSSHWGSLWVLKNTHMLSDVGTTKQTSIMNRLSRT